MKNNLNEDKKQIFWLIVEDIVKHPEFVKLKNIPHHRGNRFDHSLKVAYTSFSIAYDRGLDYESVARGAILHDFFFTDNTKLTTKKEMRYSLNNHPKIALNNATKYFNLNLKEQNIILSHMFPLGKTLPIYRESILVSSIDKKESFHEVYNYSKFISRATFLSIIMFLLNK